LHAISKQRSVRSSVQLDAPMIAMHATYFAARATSLSNADDFGLVAVLRIRMSGGSKLERP
jgi:hypothetical protein